MLICQPSQELFLPQDAGGVGSPTHGGYGLSSAFDGLTKASEWLRRPDVLQDPDVAHWGVLWVLKTMRLVPSPLMQRAWYWLPILDRLTPSEIADVLDVVAIELRAAEEMILACRRIHGRNVYQMPRIDLSQHGWTVTPYGWEKEQVPA